ALRGADVDDRVAKARAEVLRAIEMLPAESDAEVRARRDFAGGFIASMPERYVLTNAPFAIAAHAELACQHEREAVRGALGRHQASVAIVPSRHPEAAEICVVAADRPGLLAAITAAITASRLEVHAAQIHSRQLADGQVQAVDLFWVRD